MQIDHLSIEDATPVDTATFALPDVLATAVTDDQLHALRLAYHTPQRAYHHVGHVAEVFAQYWRVVDGPDWHQPAEVGLAILYHDAIYDAGRSDNETRSAALAASEIARCMPDVGIDVVRVVQLIELTARHGSVESVDLPADADGDDSRLFLDCDMAILGADSAAFDAYDRGIAEEYRGRVPAWLFKRKRYAFLQSLLDRPRIYLSDYFHARLDATARRNLWRVVSATG